MHGATSKKLITPTATGTMRIPANNIQKWIKKNNFFILNKLMVFMLTTKTLDIIWINKKVICL